MRSILFSLLLLSFLLHPVYVAESKQSNVQPDSNQLYQVVRAIDADTLELSGGERVRLIGIDTPESRYNSKLYRDAKRTGEPPDGILAMGKLAHRFTKDLVEGKKVRLEFDVQQRDRYGRLLAYVFLEDSTFVNAEIVKQGYAQIMTVPPNVKYKDLFLRLQKEAREDGRGLWASNDGYY